MDKTETTLQTFMKDLEEFYNYKEWFFTTVNCVEIDESSAEIQYIFSKYGEIDMIKIFFMKIDYTDTLPSITPLIPSAIMSEREIVDMFGIKIEGITKGLYLEEDSLQTPLRKGEIS